MGTSFTEVWEFAEIDMKRKKRGVIHDSRKELEKKISLDATVLFIQFIFWLQLLQRCLQHMIVHPSPHKLIYQLVVKRR